MVRVYRALDLSESFSLKCTYSMDITKQRNTETPIIAEPEANNCFSINTQVIISKKRKTKTFQRENHLHLQWQKDYWQPFCPSR